MTHLAPELDSTASVQPRILILDDEFTQRAGLCLQLSAVGYFDFIEFDDPRPALEYLRHHPVDLVIVDIRMSHLPVDGLWFMEQFRAFDFVTSIIIRTAHDDLAIADAALEARAIRRVLKSHPQAADLLRRSVALGIVETRNRRRTQRDAATAVSTRETLVDLLARTDDQLTVAEMCRGFAASLVDPIDTLTRHTAALDRPDLSPAETRRLAAHSRTALAQLRAQVTAFLNNAYFTGAGNAPGTTDVDDCLDALAAALTHHQILTTRDLHVAFQRPPAKLYFHAAPPHVLTALRHLAEYCALHARRSSRLAIGARLEPDPHATLATPKPGHFVLNARAATAQPCIALTLHAELVHFNLELLRNALRTCAQDPRVANLLLLSAAIVDHHLVFEASLDATHGSTFTLYLPAVPPPRPATSTETTPPPAPAA